MAADGEPEKLKRERAGTYVTADGRFTVEQSSSGWLLLDAEQTDGLGLPLTRGPFATLDEAREGIAGARRGPAPVIELPVRREGDVERPRASKAPSRGGRGARPAGGDEDAGGEDGAAESTEPEPAARPRPAKAARAARTGPSVTIREYRTVDGDALRALWKEAGFRSLGDDDKSLGRLARRNPGLLLVATEGTRIVGSALGAWDGRRGWIYHVAVAASHRRQGIATRLVTQVEDGLRDLDCPKVSVLVREENDDGAEFWVARGYERGSRQFAREL